MALHRDIYWVGRQWAVTGYGVQACDQRQKSKFDIEASRLWEDELLEGLRAHVWLNSEDFETALTVARQRFPEPARNPAPPPDAIVLPAVNGVSAAPSAGGQEHRRPETPKSEVAALPEFAMRFAASAKLARPWRIRLKR
jgi:hypothetical protein